MSPPSSTIILFFRLQATNVVWNKTSIHIQLFVKRNGEYFDVVIVLWDCCTHWGDQTVGVIINCCCHRLKYGAVIWVFIFSRSKRTCLCLCPLQIINFSKSIQLCSNVIQIVNYKVVCLPLWRWSRGKIREGCVSWTKAEVLQWYMKRWQGKEKRVGLKW